MASQHLTAAEIDVYLQRIAWGHSDGLKPSLEVLARLMRLHQLAIPFENASMHVSALKAPISIELSAVFAKLVASGRRGGWCYEQNGLFSAVLRTLGFDVVDGAARVASPDPTSPGRLRLGPHYHQVLFVSLDGRRWLVDVGFGARDQLPLPMLLPAGAERHLPPDGDAACPYADERWAGLIPGDAAATLALQRRFSVRPGLPSAPGQAADPASIDNWQLRGGYFLRKAPRGAGEPRDILWFRLDEHLQQDYELANQCVQHVWAQMLHPVFTGNLVVARQLPCGGRITLLNDLLRWYSGGAADEDSTPRKERRLAGPDEVAAALAEHFGISAGSN
ncbi:hypothetical protein ABPG77_000182 [Micractinium sp. CCAP 211/92]